jgi:predicted small lipoprotein YifL
MATALVLAATLLLGACGQKGALRMASEPAAPPATASAPAR